MKRASIAASRHVNQAERIDKQYRGSVIDPQRLRLPKLHIPRAFPALPFITCLITLCIGSFHFTQFYFLLSLFIKDLYGFIKDLY